MIAAEQSKMLMLPFTGAALVCGSDPAKATDPNMPPDSSQGPSLLVRGDLSVRLLALELSADASETYHVSFSPEPGAPFRGGTLRHAADDVWGLTGSDSATLVNIPFGSPDDLFAAALGQSAATSQVFAAMVSAAAPHWPNQVTSRLTRRRLSGAGTIAFDADWFLSELATSAIDRPLLFPGATSKLGLAGLRRASNILRQSGATQSNTPDNSLTNILLQSLHAERASSGPSHWAGEGRWIGEYPSGELAQLGTDIGDGCRASIGSGLRQVVFAPDQPLGLSLGPLQPADPSPETPQAHRGDESDQSSLGMGIDVGEVEPGGAADRAGVIPGMVLSRLSDPTLVASNGGRSSVPFETVLDEIDRRRAAGLALSVTFDSAAPVTNLYAVEMPANAVLAALAAASGSITSTMAPLDIAVGDALNALCEGALLWREDTPRLFLGEASSMTCAHTDICPQLELAHGLFGLKILGVASHKETARLSAEHGGNEAAADEAAGYEATRVPTDRPLTPTQSRLLGDTDITLALLQQGDLAVFDSGALHFASNGANGPSGALYHGVITAAAVPRLRIAAAKPAESHTDADGAYRHHLFAADLLRVVETLMASRHRRQ